MNISERLRPHTAGHPHATHRNCSLHDHTQTHPTGHTQAERRPPPDTPSAYRVGWATQCTTPQPSARSADLHGHGSGQCMSHIVA
eukprot:4167482-Prymnesium_polylepis.2